MAGQPPVQWVGSFVLAQLNTHWPCGCEVSKGKGPASNPVWHSYFPEQPVQDPVPSLQHGQPGLVPEPQRAHLGAIPHQAVSRVLHPCCACTQTAGSAKWFSLNLQREIHPRKSRCLEALPGLNTKAQLLQHAPSGRVLQDLLYSPSPFSSILHPSHLFITPHSPPDTLFLVFPSNLG